MRGLYEVVVVDPEDESTWSEYVVATDEAKAKIKALKAMESDHDVDDLDILVRRLGDVRPRRSVQEVKVVKE